MDNETEVIRQQMEGTRTALSEKLEILETQLTEKVQQTGETVAETVATVAETVDNVKETVQETVEAVSHSFDLKWHAERHPWALVGGAVFLGFVGGRMLSRPSRPQARDYDRRPPPAPIEPKPRASILGSLGQVGQEIFDLKKLGIGLAMGVLREVVAKAIPDSLSSPVSEVVNGLTVRLGGQPMGESHKAEQSNNDPASHEESSCPMSRSEGVAAGI
jgi:hypothetical protein